MSTPSLHAVTPEEAATMALRARALTSFKARYSHNPESQRAMVGALRRLAITFTGGRCDETSFPWEIVIDGDLSERLCGTVAKHYSENTATKDASALRQMLDCCRRVGLLTYEQYRLATTFEVRGGAHRPPPGTYLTEADIGTIARAAATGPGHETTRIRDTALVLTFASSGARGWEITGATLGQTFLDESRIWLERTKGGRQRNAWLHPVAVEALRAWVAVRGNTPGPLFVPLACNGRPMIEHGGLSPHQARKIIRRTGDEAGFTGVTPHDLRRFLVSNLLESHDLTLVATVVGHRNPATTAGYDRRPLRKQRAAVASLVIPSLGTLGVPTRR